MNKILITIVVPMIEKEYDVFIPVSKNVGVAKKLIIKAINELTENHFPIKDKCTLMSSNGDILSNMQTIKECNIKNGDKIILI